MVRYNMEPVIRGVVEEQLDRFLLEDHLKYRVENFKVFRDLGLIKTLEDVMFGALVESLANTLVFYKGQMGSRVTVDEMRKLMNIVTNRSLEIKSKIANAINL